MLFSNSAPLIRVLSRCDRILWKTTVLPDPEPGPEAVVHAPSRNPMLHVLQALRPLSLRPRKDSEASAHSTDAPRSSTYHSARRSQEQQRREDMVGTSVQSHGPPRLHLGPIDSLSNLMRPVLSRTVSYTPVVVNDQGHARNETSAGGVRMQHTQTLQPSSVSNSEIPMSHSLSSTGLPPLSHSAAAESPHSSRWLGFLPFLHRDSTISSPESVPPRRGEVVCLEYRTLDDRAMRRLEGRSDHRPVIGSYAIYL